MSTWSIWQGPPSASVTAAPVPLVAARGDNRHGGLNGGPQFRRSLHVIRGHASVSPGRDIHQELRAIADGVVITPEQVAERADVAAEPFGAQGRIHFIRHPEDPVGGARTADGITTSGLHPLKSRLGNGV